jgi:hypothetical protein
MKYLAALILTTFCGAVYAITPVQAVHSQHYSVTSLTIALASVAAGDCITLEPSWNVAEAPTSVIDSNGTPTLAGTFGSSASPSQGIYYEGSAAAGTHTFTLTVPTAASFQLWAQEWPSNVTCVLDGSTPSVLTGNSATVASNSITPSVSGDLALFFANTFLASITMSSWANGFTVGATNGSNFTSGWAYQTYASVSPLSGGVSLSTGGAWSGSVILLKVSGSSCTNSGQTAAGALAIPNGTTGSYLLKNGSIGTPDCSTVSYKQPLLGNFGVN